MITPAPVKLTKEISGRSGIEIAALLDMEPAQLSKLDTGEQKPSPDTLRKLAGICGLSEKEFQLALREASDTATSLAVAFENSKTGEPLLIDPEIYKQAYAKAKAVEKQMLGTRGSNKDFGQILDGIYRKLKENKDRVYDDFDI